MAAHSVVVEDWTMSDEHPRPSGTHLARGPLYGRQSELRVLEDAFDAVINDGGLHLVTLVGASGVGKTRLVAEFLTRAREIPGSPAPACSDGCAP